MGNILGDAIRMRQAGFDELQGFKEQRARNQAGQALSQGDYQGGAGALYQGGLIDQGQQVEKAQTERQDHEREVQLKQQEMQGKALIRITQALKNVPQGSRAAKLREIAPVFQQVGIDPTPFMGLSEQQLDNPSLDAFSGEVVNHIKLFSTSGGVVAIDQEALQRNMQDPNAAHVVYQDPWAGELKQAQIEATRARADASYGSADAAHARADRARRTPIGRAGGGGGGGGLDHIKTEDLIKAVRGY